VRLANGSYAIIWWTDMTTKTTCGFHKHQSCYKFTCWTTRSNTNRKPNQ